MTTIAALESELAELTTLYMQACDRIRELEQGPTPTTGPRLVSQPMPEGAVLHEYVPCSQTGIMWARRGRALHEARTCAVVVMQDGGTRAFRKWKQAQAWIEAGMPEFALEHEW